MFSHHKMDTDLIPAPLQNLPNVTYVDEPPVDIRPDRCVRTGCKISIPEVVSLRLDEDFSFGTLGFVGTLENLGPQRHVLVTAGHVVDDALSVLIHGTDEKTYNTEVVMQFKRFLGVPQFRLGEQDVPGPVSLNQICLLEQQGIPSEILQCTFLPIDCCRLSMPDDIVDDPLLMSRAPIFSDMSKLCNFIRKGYGIRVHKYGAGSGLTNGTLSDIQQPVFKLPVYLLIIKWDSPEEQFAVGGDSGSLTWAKDEETIIPLGLHCGSAGTISYSLSLQSICQNISDLLDADLLFCVSEECGSDAVCDMPAVDS